MTFAPSEYSDQPGHPPSLIRVFNVRMRKPWVLSYPLRAQRRLWSDWADAQADLSLRLAHRLFCWFCHEAAQICGWVVCWFFSFNCRVVTVKVPHTSLLWHIPPLCYPNSFSPLSFFLETTRVLTSVKAARLLCPDRCMLYIWLWIPDPYSLNRMGKIH